MSWLARIAGRDEWADKLHRLYQFQQQGALPDEASVFADVAAHYPRNTRFIALPMDMRCIGHGEVPVSLREQHDALARLRSTRQARGAVIPFATVNPLVPGSVEECKRALTDLRFAGLKIYPRMGFAPDHPDLMEEIYPLVSDLNLPVMTHCSRGGVQGKRICNYRGDAFTRPKAYLPVLRRFPQMRICLAHFGGQDDWVDYAAAQPTRGNENWMVQIREMIGSGEFPNLWTDISYTMFHFQDLAPILKLILTGGSLEARRLRSRVLFGSDFYMTRQEELSERAVCIRLREKLGEELFWQLAETGPEVWLGERDEDKSLWTLQG
ncbi:hypothetical protein RA20_02730 [Leisingera sp. ANG-Vp]|nr:hypothetical protein RA20_02730 [Leisingera sp. ANG-Vp]